jgi:hypothetical protein
MTTTNERAPETRTCNECGAVTIITEICNKCGTVPKEIPETVKRELRTILRRQQDAEQDLHNALGSCSVEAYNILDSFWSLESDQQKRLLDAIGLKPSSR